MKKAPLLQNKGAHLFDIFPRALLLGKNGINYFGCKFGRNFCAKLSFEAVPLSFWADCIIPRTRCKSKKKPQTVAAQQFAVWCRWWDLNPHVVANNGF